MRASDAHWAWYTAENKVGLCVCMPAENRPLVSAARAPCPRSVATQSPAPRRRFVLTAGSFLAAVASSTPRLLDMTFKMTSFIGQVTAKSISPQTLVLFCSARAQNNPQLSATLPPIARGNQYRFCHT